MSAARSREVLLVGSVHLASNEEVFATVAGVLGERVARIPDGETGYARSLWIQCQIPFFLGHPQLEMVEPDPDRPGQLRPARIPAHGIYSETMAGFFPGKARLREGVAPDELRFENVGYADWGLESYAVFKRLREGGIIPRATRFQVCIPSPGWAAWITLPDQMPVILAAYETALFREIERLADEIPSEELAIQWDCTDPDPYQSGPPEFRAPAIERLVRLAGGVPEPVELGYHLCYGDLEHEHRIQPEDLGIVVEMAALISQGVARSIEWFHMPVPRDRSDGAYFAPLRELNVKPGARLFLGLVHHTDGLEGTRKRMEEAAAVYPDFGIATECGFGRRPPETIPELLRIHTEAADTGVPV